MFAIFKSVNLKPASMQKIKICNEIIEEYLTSGLRLTLRQLYYQLVTKNIIPNLEKSYKQLSSLISDARLTGLIDWDAIEDRVRQPKVPSEFDDLAELIDAAIHSYRLPRWQGQEHYVELWVEKDALAGVLTPLARQHHITLMVNRGYSSQSAMYESALRFLKHEGSPVLLYLGDHDPSGEDMVRDITDRLIMFGVKSIEVRKIALTMAQIEQYNPPPNPAKHSDPRAAAYIALHGESSWEVDALPPRVLHQLIDMEIGGLVDSKKLEAVIRQETVDIERYYQAYPAPLGPS